MDERRGRVTNATRGMHLVRFEWQYCTSTSVIGRSASIATIDKKRVLSIPTNFSFQTLRVFAKYISKIYITYIYSLFSTKRPTFFRNQPRPVWIIDDRWEYLSFLFFEIWKIVRSKGGREGKERIVFSRSLVRDIFTPQSRARDIARDSPLNEPKPRR